MRKTTKQINAAAWRKIAEAYLETVEAENFDVHGLRMLPEDMEDVEVGDILENSYRWVDGCNTGEELGGTCAVGTTPHGNPMKAIAAFARNNYYGKKVAIVGGNIYEWGEDDGEVIIRDPEVIAIFDIF